MIDREIEHVKGGIPPGRDVSWHEKFLKLESGEKGLPGWQNRRGRVDDLEGEFAKLCVESQISHSGSEFDSESTHLDDQDPHRQNARIELGLLVCC
jgi:hypothetical protein